MSEIDLDEKELSISTHSIIDNIFLSKNMKNIDLIKSELNIMIGFLNLQSIEVYCDNKTVEIIKDLEDFILDYKLNPTLNNLAQSFKIDTEKICSTNLNNGVFDSTFTVNLFGINLIVSIIMSEELEITINYKDENIFEISPKDNLIEIWRNKNFYEDGWGGNDILEFMKTDFIHYMEEDIIKELYNNIFNEDYKELISLTEFYHFINHFVYNIINIRIPLTIFQFKEI